MLTAASLSIEPFEVSRLRLRRTRRQPVWISNGFLVLGRLAQEGANGDWRVDPVAAEALKRGSGARRLDAFRTGSTA
jgi:hypothetical protein